MSLKFSFSVLWLLIFAAVCAGTDFYVWRRGWDDAESGILPPLSGDGLTILAAELEKDGRVSVVNVPPTLWQSPRRTAAIRVHVGWLGRKKLENTLAVIIERLPRELPVQLDIDVPESRLAEYAPLLKRLRRRFPARVFSITALPCHLRHREFLAAAEQVDYYVLQLHGVEAPKQLGKEVALMERRTALAVVAAAKKLKLPFRIALPSYAYQFNYRSSDGRFSHIGSGNFPGMVARLAAPDPELIADVIAAAPDVPRIWFRLPQRNDRLVWELETIRALDRGERVRPVLEAVWKRPAPERLELWIRSRAMIRLGRTQLHLSWPENARGESRLLNGTSTPGGPAVFGVLPELLEVEIPACGTEQQAAYFLTTEQPRDFRIDQP